MNLHTTKMIYQRKKAQERKFDSEETWKCFMPRKQRIKRVLDYVPGTAGCWQIQTLDAGAHSSNDSPRRRSKTEPLNHLSLVY